MERGEGQKQRNWENAHSLNRTKKESWRSSPGARAYPRTHLGVQINWVGLGAPTGKEFRVQMSRFGFEEKGLKKQVEVDCRES